MNNLSKEALEKKIIFAKKIYIKPLIIKAKTNNFFDNPKSERTKLFLSQIL